MKSLLMPAAFVLCGKKVMNKNKQTKCKRTEQLGLKFVVPPTTFSCLFVVVTIIMIYKPHSLFDVLIIIIK